MVINNVISDFKFLWGAELAGNFRITRLALRYCRKFNPMIS